MFSLLLAIGAHRLIVHLQPLKRKILMQVLLKLLLQINVWDEKIITKTCAKYCEFDAEIN
jgi:hypothetical protein